MSHEMERLAAAVATRKQELGLSQESMRDNGGPSVPTISRILEGSGPAPSRVTFAKLDRALKWAPGSARRVWENGEEPSNEDANAEMDAQRASFKEIASAVLRPGVVVVQMSRVSVALELADEVARLVGELPNAPEELTEAADELRTAAVELWGSAVSSARPAGVMQRIIEQWPNGSPGE